MFIRYYQDNNLEDGLDCPLEEDELEEEEYDALNDETFGPDATIGDWEEDHEKLAEITESNRPHNQNATNKKVCCRCSRYIFHFSFLL